MALAEWQLQFDYALSEIPAAQRSRAGAVLSVIPGRDEWEQFVADVRKEWWHWEWTLASNPACMVVLYDGAAFFNYRNGAFWEDFARVVNSPPDQSEINRIYKVAARRYGLPVIQGNYVTSAVAQIGVPISMWDGFLHVCEWALWANGWDELDEHAWESAMTRRLGGRKLLISFLIENRESATELIREMLEARRVLASDRAMTVEAISQALFLRPEYFEQVPETANFLGREPAHEYLAHVGFFQWLGISVGKVPGSLTGGATWLPVTTLARAELDQRITETGKPLGSVIQQECERLARLVTQSNQFKVTAPLAYCLREVIRNVFEHAETDRCVFCAQKCFDGSIELAVIDQGRGIRRSLEERLQFASDEEALRVALRPGVSRNPSKDTENPWGNSGFGLFVLSEIGRELGTFRVVSGQAGLHLSGNETCAETAAFGGTAIQLRFLRPKGANLANYIESIIARGEGVSNYGAAARASRSTRGVTPVS